MSHQYICNEQVNIDIYPELDLAYKAVAGSQFTLGDLHGNAVKLLYVLTRHGFVDISREDYAEYVRIYRKYRLQAKDLQDMDAILSRIQLKPEAQKSFLRLIGDVLADRGMNDYFTLKLFKKLHNERILFEVLISNHDAEFIKCVEKKLPFNTSKLGEKQANSSYKLHQLLNRDLIKREEVIELFETNYKPALKALSYSFNESQDKITIYSHGMIGINNIEHIAKALDVPFYGTEPNELAQTIDEINIRFSEHVAQNTITDLLNLEKIDIDAINGKIPIDEQQFPLAHLIWNRKVEGLIRPEHIVFVHGHEMNDKTLKNIINLDNDLAKDLCQHKGMYNGLFSRETTGLRPNHSSTAASFQSKEESLFTWFSNWLWGASPTCTPAFHRQVLQPLKQPHVVSLEQQQQSALSTAAIGVK